jgi:hypothetical protein
LCPSKIERKVWSRREANSQMQWRSSWYGRCPCTVLVATFNPALVFSDDDVFAVRGSGTSPDDDRLFPMICAG